METDPRQPGCSAHRMCAKAGLGRARRPFFCRRDLAAMYGVGKAALPPGALSATDSLVQPAKWLRGARPSLESAHGTPAGHVSLRNRLYSVRSTPFSVLERPCESSRLDVPAPGIGHVHEAGGRGGKGGARLDPAEQGTMTLRRPCRLEAALPDREYWVVSQFSAAPREGSRGERPTAYRCTSRRVTDQTRRHSSNL